MSKKCPKKHSKPTVMFSTRDCKTLLALVSNRDYGRIAQFSRHFVMRLSTGLPSHLSNDVECKPGNLADDLLEGHFLDTN